MIQFPLNMLIDMCFTVKIDNDTETILLFLQKMYKPRTKKEKDIFNNELVNLIEERRELMRKLIS